VVFVFCPSAYLSRFFAGRLQSIKNKKGNSRGEERMVSNGKDRQGGAPVFLP
jgi:hypothetical protein